MRERVCKCTQTYVFLYRCISTCTQQEKNARNKRSTESVGYRVSVSERGSKRDRENE